MSELSRNSGSGDAWRQRVPPRRRASIMEAGGFRPHDPAVTSDSGSWPPERIDLEPGLVPGSGLAPTRHHNFPSEITLIGMQVESSHDKTR
jgi:hypothetical protein